MKIFENQKELREYLKTKKVETETILEEEDKFWVYTKEGVLKFPKMVPHAEAIEKIWRTTPKKPFKNLLEFLENPQKNKAYKAIKVFQESGKKVLLLTGPAGVGKTTVSLYGLYDFIRKREVVNPLYFSVITDIRDENLHLKVIEADGFVIDDLNISVGDYDLKIARKIILYALENDYPLFITSNNTFKELTTKIFEQHMKSRIEEQGLVIPIKDKDYRIEKVLKRRKEANKNGKTG